MILLCTGSQITLAPVKGLAEVGYHTSDTILHITELPKSVAILGGGYIATECDTSTAAGIANPSPAVDTIKRPGWLRPPVLQGVRR